MNTFNVCAMMLASFTTAQWAVLIVLGILLLGMIVADFVIFYNMMKHRHELLIEEKNSLSGKLTEAETHITALNAAAASRSTKKPFISVEEDLDDEDNALIYNKSFKARLIQTDDNVKEWYTDIKNTILSFKGIKDNMTWKFESFRYKRRNVIKMTVRGKTLCLYFALDPKKYEESKVKIEDVSDIVSMKDTPTMLRITSDRRAKNHALILIEDIMKELATEKLVREPVDYYLPYAGTVTLIKRGLVKRVVVAQRTLPKDNTKNPEN